MNDQNIFSVHLKSEAWCVSSVPSGGQRQLLCSGPRPSCFMILSRPPPRAPDSSRLGHLWFRRISTLVSLAALIPSRARMG